MLHNHPCITCGWRFPCTCNDPSQHDDPCFECAGKAPSLTAGGVSPPPATRTPTDETSPVWGRFWTPADARSVQRPADPFAEAFGDIPPGVGR